MTKDKLKILLVDDETEFVDSLSERLGLRGMKTDVAYDGEQALKAVEKSAPDAMVLDLRMPGMDGIEVLEKVKKDYPNIRVIVLTGHGTDEDEAKALKLGASVFMKKPVDIDQLVKILRKERMKVLLVDDEKEFVDSLSERLELRNVEAGIAYDGEQAIKAVDEEEPDVLVLDLRMPGIDGIEVLRRVKKSHPEMPVVILTGHGTEDDEKKARRMGASAYLKKPVDVNQLTGVLQKVVGRFKKSKKVVDTMLMAAALAQAGETEYARETLEELEEDKNKDRKKDKK